MFSKNKAIELFVEAWNDIPLEDKISIHNSYCVVNNYEYEIFSNEDDFINEYFSTPAEAVKAAVFGHYSYGDDYVWFNGYANIESGSFEDTLPLTSAQELAEWFVKNENYSDIDYLDEMSDFIEYMENRDENDEEEEDSEDEDL